ncbi:MAG: class I SAM-dependent DNA methyltransferase [Anaerolineae bacterium]
MSEFAKHMTARLLDHAQRHNWMGRNITDLGCGTGESLMWLSQHGYVVTGIDTSAEMLAIAQANLDQRGLTAQLIHSDFQTVTNVTDQDMVLALDILSELSNIRELESAFKHIHGMLGDDRWFVFDMYTIEGLVKRNQEGYQMLHDGPQLTLFASDHFDYEKSIQRREFLIFSQKAGETGWQRESAQRVLRAYPVQGITALVQRSGFSIQHVLNMNMSNYSPNQSTDHVIIFARKE